MPLLQNPVSMTPRGKGCEDKMGYQATIKKQGLLAIFDIKGDASAVAKRLSKLGFSLPKNKIRQLKRMASIFAGLARHNGCCSHLRKKKLNY